MTVVGSSILETRLTSFNGKVSKVEGEYNHSVSFKEGVKILDCQESLDFEIYKEITTLTGMQSALKKEAESNFEIEGCDDDYSWLDSNSVISCLLSVTNTQECINFLISKNVDILINARCQLGSGAIILNQDIIQDYKVEKVLFDVASFMATYKEHTVKTAEAVANADVLSILKSFKTGKEFYAGLTCIEHLDVYGYDLENVRSEALKWLDTANLK